MTQGAPATSKTILIVDDDEALGEMLSIVLESEGFSTRTCLDGFRAMQVISTIQPDLMLLDVMLPSMNGIEVARNIRNQWDIPIIMLTAKSDTSDVIAGLEAGADDYVSKPFNGAELVARIRARLRFSKPSFDETMSDSSIVQHVENGPIVMDRPSHKAWCMGRDLRLTPMEFELLFALACNAGKTLSRSELLKKVWGYESSGDTRLVSVQIQRLRAKVEDDPENPKMVATVRGIGYKLVGE